MVCAACGITMCSMAAGVAPAIAADPPTCRSEQAVTQFNAPVTVAESCTDATGAPVTSAVAARPAYGSATVDPGGTSMTYTPSPGFSGVDSFTYQGTSANGTSGPATITVSVSPGPPPLYPIPGSPGAAIESPVANADYFWRSVPPAAFSCSAGTDNTLRSCTATVDGAAIANGQPLPDGIGNHTMVVTATDSDGHAATATASYVASLSFPPPVSITAPRQGAKYHLDQVVRARYTCLATTSGPPLASCKGPVAAGKPINTRTLGRHTFTVTATDATGNSTRETVGYRVVPTTNRFTAGRPSLGRKGLVRVTLRLPGPGIVTMVATGVPAAGSPTFRYGRVRHRARRAGKLALRLAPSRVARASVARSGAGTRLRIAVTYTPTGGKPRVVRLRPVPVG